MEEAYKEMVQKRIDNLLNNTQGETIRNRKNGKLGSKPKPLVMAQLVTLRDYADFYANKPSPRGGTVKPKSVIAMLAGLRELGLYLNKPFEKASQKDLISWVKDMNKRFSQSTISRYKTDVRTFFKWIYKIKDKHKFPEVVDHELLVPQRVNTSKKPNDLLTKDEVMKMVNYCFEPRSKAVIMALYEGGLRDGELASTNVDSVTFDSYGCKLIVEESKSKKREVRLIETAPFLRQWLDIHPLKDNPKAPLFCGLCSYKGKRLIPNGINLIVRRAGERAGIRKRVHGHLLRHCAITRLQKKGLDIVLNAKRHGITTTTLEKVYLHYDDKDVDDAFLRIHKAKGDEELVKEAEEEQKLSPKKCEFCNFINPYESSYCEQCKRPVDMATFAKKEQEQENKLAGLENQMKEMSDVLSKIAGQQAALSQDDAGRMIVSRPKNR